MKLSPTLSAELASRRVQVETPDADTLLLRRVPVLPGLFSKTRTNLLLKRWEGAQRFLVLVDETLEYLGEDQRVQQLFRPAARRSGWRALDLRVPDDHDPERALQTALSALGFYGQEQDAAAGTPPIAAAARPSLLDRLSLDCTAAVRPAADPPTIGRDREIEALSSCVLAWGQARLGLIVGDSGVGKTNLVQGLAHRLARDRPRLRVRLADIPEAFAGTIYEAERESILVELFRGAIATPGTVLVLDRLDSALMKTAATSALLAKAIDDGLAVVATLLPGGLRRCCHPALVRRARVISLLAPSDAATSSILSAVRSRLVAHHRVEIDAALLPIAVRLSHGLYGRMPAKAIALLDYAAANVALLGASSVSPDDLSAAAQRWRVTGG